jgi:hypothetical protein
MMERLLELWTIAPAAVILLIVLWAGHKGWWYWDAGVRRLVEQLERERDVWRTLACALLKKDGVSLPDAFTTIEGDLPTMSKVPQRRVDPPEADPWKTGE